MEDLTGQRFGKLTVMRQGEKSNSGRVTWICRCDCGNEKQILAYSLKNGDTKSCGCGHYANPHRTNLDGQKFGRLTALEYLMGSKYLCKCDCGNTTVVDTYRLKNGKTQSCGCLRQETAAKKATKHNGAAESLYHVLSAMHQRCENPNNKDFKWYGALGVTVCEEWALTNYHEFRGWALANGYQPGLTIDREDPDGNYCPENCRWITIQEQQRNRRNSKTRKDLGVKQMTGGDFYDGYG